MSPDAATAGAKPITEISANDSVSDTDLVSCLNMHIMPTSTEFCENESASELIARVQVVAVSLIG